MSGHPGQAVEAIKTRVGRCRHGRAYIRSTYTEYIIVHLSCRNQEWVVAGLRVHVGTASSTRTTHAAWSTKAMQGRCKITKQLQSCNELYLFLRQLQAYMLRSTMTRKHHQSAPRVVVYGVRSTEYGVEDQDSFKKFNFLFV